MLKYFHSFVHRSTLNLERSTMEKPTAAQRMRTHIYKGTYTEALEYVTRESGHDVGPTDRTDAYYWLWATVARTLVGGQEKIDRYYYNARRRCRNYTIDLEVAFHIDATLAFLRHGDIYDAAKAADEAILTGMYDPHSGLAAMAWSVRGRAYAAAGDDAEAIEAYRLAEQTWNDIRDRLIEDVNERWVVDTVYYRLRSLIGYREQLLREIEQATGKAQSLLIQQYAVIERDIRNDYDALMQHDDRRYYLAATMVHAFGFRGLRMVDRLTAPAARTPVPTY